MPDDLHLLSPNSPLVQHPGFDSGGTSPPRRHRHLLQTRIMNRCYLAVVLAVGVLSACQTHAQSVYEPYAFTTLAGLALTPDSTNDTGSAARFDTPWGLAVDGANNVYVADTQNHTIRKITAGGVVTTLAGVAGTAGFNEGAASTSLFSRPTGVAVNSAGTVVYVADYNNHIIRQISGGIVTTLAGTAGVPGIADDVGTAAQFQNPFGVAVNSAGTVVYVTDQNNQTIRQIDVSSGVVTTLAGAPSVGGSTDDSANNLNARFNTPKGIAVDGGGNVYVADTGNFTVRKIFASGGVSTLAGSVFTSGFDDGQGSLTRFSPLYAFSPYGGPCGVAVDGGGNIYVTDQGNHTIRKITPAGSVTTLAGLALTSGGTDGVGSGARFNNPAGVAVDSAGTLYVADTLNHTIRIGVTDTNRVPVLTCATDKTVECGTAWTFDPPIVDDGDALTMDEAPTILSTLTNGTCPMVITRTWQVADASGTTNTCSQTVTVEDTTPPVMVCAPDKNVECGSDWTFDEPTATDNCTDTELTITIVDTVSDGGTCPERITRTWEATDACGNTSLCSQTVTVMDTTPPVLTCANPSVVVFSAGTTDDDFVGPEPAFPSAGLLLRLQTAGISSFKGFDDCNLNTFFAHTFTNLPPCITGAKLRVRFRACGSDLNANDIFGLSFSAPSGELAPVSWSRFLGNGNATPGLFNESWGAGSTGEVELDLANLLNPDGTVTDLIPALNAQGFLDLVLQDDTSIDYAVLTVTSCCVSDKTVECGSVWDFDAPTATDSCSGAEVPVTILSTVTSGTCPEMITRTWEATDACGNVGTVSQTVTVEDTTPPVMVCAPDKDVECGTAWDFDLPSATDNCGGAATRPLVVSVSIVDTVSDGGTCLEKITRTWEATDACGNTSLCSQTVTLRDTEPPVITCPKNIIFVALDKNCQLVIPTIEPPASDNCTPRSRLVFTQDPPAGTVVRGPCQFVTVTVRDACENTSQCRVQVCGQDKTPPTLVCPKSVSLTDCFVPDVLALVSATDNCTAANQLVFTQSPPPGTAIAAGGNMVTVTVTDQAGNTSICFIPLTSSGSQSFLDVMFNTGVDSNKAHLPFSSVDPHYTISSVPIGTPTGPGLYNAPDALVGPQWMTLPPFTLSRWISLYGNNSENQYPPGFYPYRNQFVLPSGMDPSTASISGRWSAGSGGKMYLNGSLTPASTIPTASLGSFWPYWTPFIINSGFLAFPAVNTITFVVETPARWGGMLRVEFTDARINCATCTPPAILHKTPNQSQPLNSTAVLSVSVWGTPPLTIQWYHNNLPLSNGGHFAGVNTPTLTVTPLGYADAGTYYAVVSNACGVIRGNPAKLTVTKGWPSWGGWWNFSRLDKPLAAVFGSDLIVVDASNSGLPSVSSGTTFDFGLPNIGGKPANVLHVPAEMPTGTFIKLPLAELTDGKRVSNFTLVQDFYTRSDSAGSITLLTISDHWGYLEFSTVPGAAGMGLNISGMIGDMPINLNSAMPLQNDDWNRACLVIENNDSSGSDRKTGSLNIYINGKRSGTIGWDDTDKPPVLTSESMVTVMSAPDSPTTTESYVSSIAFFTDALAPDTIAGFGSPNNGPIPANDTSIGDMTVGVDARPALSISMANGMLNLPCLGDGFQLQETADLSRGVWVDSVLPFDQIEVNGVILTTCRVNPTLSDPRKFYRLIYKP